MKTIVRIQVNNTTSLTATSWVNIKIDLCSTKPPHFQFVEGPYFDIMKKLGNSHLVLLLTLLGFFRSIVQDKAYQKWFKSHGM